MANHNQYIRERSLDDRLESLADDGLLNTLRIEWPVHNALQPIATELSISDCKIGMRIIGNIQTAISGELDAIASAEHRRINNMNIRFVCSFARIF